MSSTVKLGLDVLGDCRPDWLRGRLGLLVNQASHDASFRPTWESLQEWSGGGVGALFSPQHGLHGDKQDNMVESAHGRHGSLEIPVHSLYSETREPTDEMMAGLETFVIDLQDVGCRVYTFAWTMLACLRTCARRSIRVVVLDRPNPVGGEKAEGARLDPAYKTFVGEAPIPLRHGLTLGELARYLNRTLQVGADLEVIPMTGWRRAMMHEDCALPWTPPSPNLPRREGVMLYPGQVILEGTNLSEGRGTTTPFEVCGAPFVEPDQWWKVARDRGTLAGVRARPTEFEPMFGKWAGQRCGGLFLHVTDARVFEPVRLTYALLAAAWSLWPEQVCFTDPPYEYEQRLVPFDCITGSDRARKALLGANPMSGDERNTLTDPGKDWWRDVGQDLLYPPVA